MGKIYKLIPDLAIAFNSTVDHKIKVARFALAHDLGRGAFSAYTRYSDKFVVDGHATKYIGVDTSIEAIEKALKDGAAGAAKAAKEDMERRSKRREAAALKKEQPTALKKEQPTAPINLPQDAPVRGAVTVYADVVESLQEMADRLVARDAILFGKIEAIEKTLEALLVHTVEAKAERSAWRKLIKKFTE